jgi:hypothetical protein
VIGSGFSHFLLPMCFLVACTVEAQTTAPNKSDATKTIVERVQELEAQREIDKWTHDDLGQLTGYLSPTLDCNAGGFSFITMKNSGLSFLASCEKIEPYLEGFKITISIGNPYSMRFDQFSAAIGYGDTLYAAYTRKQSISSLAPLASGAWNTITATINQISAKDVRYIVLLDFEVKKALGK